MVCWGNYPIFPMFASWGGCCAPSLYSPCASRYISRQNMRAATVFYPNIYATPWGLGVHDTDTSYDEAVAINQLIYNPWSMPRINRGGVASCPDTSAIEEGAGRGAQKDILKIEYDCTKKEVGQIISSANSHLKSSNLTDEQRNELTAIKDRAVALQKKLEEFAKNSKDKEVSVALLEMDALRKEYGDIYDTIAEFNKKVAAARTNGNNGADGTDGNDGVDGNDGNNGNDNIKDLDSLKKDYDENLKPSIEEVLKNPKLSAEDKKKIEDKQKELDKAIQDNKPFEEIKKIYDELGEMVSGIQSKLTEALEKEKEEAAQKAQKELADKCEKLNENIGKLVQEDVALVPKKDKKAVQDALKELLDAVEAGKSTEEIKEIYDKVNKVYTQIQKKSEALRKEATEIAEQIATAADGVDWSSSQESAIKANVKKLNSKNIMAFLHIWDKDFKTNFSDTCILETIFGEFKSDSDTKKELSKHIFDAMEQYAKDNGIYNAVGGKLSALRSLCKDLGWFTSYGTIYEKFKDTYDAYKQALS